MDLLKDFHAEYVEKYGEAHASQKGASRRRVVESVRTSSPYRVLERLAAISMLGAREPLRKLNATVEEAWSKRCTSLQSEDLMASP